MKTYLSSPSGYCQGVTRAIALAMSFKKSHMNKEVYVLGTLVHNETVTNELDKYGIHSLNNNLTNEDKIKSLPDGSCLIFSAHGHDKKLEDIAKKKNITFLDATCPIVELSAKNIKDKLNEGHQVLYVGTPNHPETVGILSIDKSIILYDEYKDNLKDVIKDENVFVSCQTTLSMLELIDIFNNIKSLFPNAIFQNEICRESRLRQEAIKKLPDNVDCVFVVGGKDSSNTKKLFELSKQYFSTLKIFKILDEHDIDKDKLKGCLSAAIISGASTPLNETMKIKVKLDEIW